MTAYLRMLLSGGAGSRGRLISEESFKLLTTPVIKAPFRGEDASYAYGLWVSQNKEGRTHLRHTGGMVAFSSSMDVDLTSGLAAFASVNARLGGYRPVAVTKYALELLAAEREGGAVVEAGHGADWYAGERYKGRRTFQYPKEWDAYVGRYRHESPWYGSSRVVLRKGALWLEGEQQLVPLDGASFSLGPPNESPERIQFGPVMGGRALRMTLSTIEYNRAYTP